LDGHHGVAVSIRACGKAFLTEASTFSRNPWERTGKRKALWKALGPSSNLGDGPLIILSLLLDNIMEQDRCANNRDLLRHIQNHPSSIRGLWVQLLLAILVTVSSSWWICQPTRQWHNTARARKMKVTEPPTHNLIVSLSTLIFLFFFLFPILVSLLPLGSLLASKLFYKF
jgi:hypothetical protein